MPLERHGRAEGLRAIGAARRRTLLYSGLLYLLFFPSLLYFASSLLFFSVLYSALLFSFPVIYLFHTPFLSASILVGIHGCMFLVLLHKLHPHTRKHTHAYTSPHEQTQTRKIREGIERQKRRQGIARLIMFISYVHRCIHVLYVHICMTAGSTAFISGRSVMCTYVDILCMYNITYAHEYTNTVACTHLAFVRTFALTCPSNGVEARSCFWYGCQVFIIRVYYFLLLVYASVSFGLSEGTDCPANQQALSCSH